MNLAPLVTIFVYKTSIKGVVLQGFDVISKTPETDFILTEAETLLSSLVIGGFFV